MSRKTRAGQLKVTKFTKLMEIKKAIGWEESEITRRPVCVSRASGYQRLGPQCPQSSGTVGVRAQRADGAASVVCCEQQKSNKHISIYWHPGKM